MFNVYKTIVMMIKNVNETIQIPTNKDTLFYHHCQFIKQHKNYKTNTNASKVKHRKHKTMKFAMANKLHASYILRYHRPIVLYYYEICVMAVLQQDCEYDSLELRSGFNGDGSGKVHGTFCGSTLPQPITSDGNELRITFSTDNTVQKTGFSAVFFTGIFSEKRVPLYYQIQCILLLSSLPRLLV